MIQPALSRLMAVAGTFKQHWKLQWSMEFWLYALLLSMVILFCCCFASHFCWSWRTLPYNHSRLYCVSSEVPEEVMHGDVGGCYCSGSLWSIFAIDEFTVLWATLPGTQNITRVAGYFITWKGKADIRRLLVHVQSRRLKQRTLKNMAGNKVCCSALQGCGFW